MTQPKDTLPTEHLPERHLPSCLKKGLPYFTIKWYAVRLLPRADISHLGNTSMPFTKFQPKTIHCCCYSSAKLCQTLCDPMDCSTPAFPVLHYLPEFAQTHVHWVGDAIQPSHSLSSPSPPDLNLSQHQGLFQWINSTHQVASVPEPQRQSLQWTFRIDLL